MTKTTLVAALLAALATAASAQQRTLYDATTGKVIARSPTDSEGPQPGWSASWSGGGYVDDSDCFVHFRTEFAWNHCVLPGVAPPARPTVVDPSSAGWSGRPGQVCSVYTSFAPVFLFPTTASARDPNHR